MTVAGALADLRQQLRPADRLVRRHEDPVLVGRARRRDLARRLPRVAVREEPPGDDRRQYHEDRHPEPAVDERRDHDQREITDRQPDEPERFSLAPEGISHQALEKIDGHVHDDPHYVDEVPIDPAQLDPVVVLGREMPAERADRHHEQDHQADEDVRSVEAGQAEERRGERGVPRVETEAAVLDELGEEERGAEAEGQDEAGLEACAVALLHRCVGPVHRRARADQDQRVQAGDEDRPVERLRRPDAVDTVVDDAIEEIDREERAEEHDLRRDEEEHAEQRRRDPRAVVDRRRPVVLVRFGGRAHALTAWRTGEITWSTGRPVSLRSRSTRSRRNQPLFSPGNVEMMISSTRSSWTTFSAAVCGSGWTICPCALIPSLRSSVRARRSLRSASPCSSVSACGATIRNAAFPCAARFRMRSSSSSESTVWFATTSTLVFSSGSRSTVTCLTGMLPAVRSISWTTSRRIQPDRSALCVETTISSTRGSSWASASLTACTGPVSTTKPCVGTPASRSTVSVRSRRRPADARRVSS